ncbi:MAG: hypothetical protein Kow00122_09950 [Thermoleophilia bacterium]
MLSADVGYGHDAAAQALSVEIAHDRPDVQVTVENGLQAMGRRLHRLIRGGYAAQLRTLPVTYDLFHGLLCRSRAARYLIGLLLSVLGTKGLRRLVRAHRPDVIVSTYPAVTMVLGHMRRTGRLRIPVFAAITDLGGVELWTHPGVDFHLVMHQRCLEAVERSGGRGSGRVVRPLVHPAFSRPLEQEKARRDLHLPTQGSLVVISGGGWGIGDLGAAAEAALVLPGTVVVVCGRNEALRAILETRFGTNPRVRIIGFTDQMSQLLAAADVLVHTTGGVTSLEALVRGCRVIAFGDLPGHLRLGSRAQEELGLAEWVRTSAQLTEAIRRALARPSPQPDWKAAASAAEAVLTARSRVRPLSVGRVWATRAAVTLTALSLIGGWTLFSDDPYSVLAHTLRLPAVSATPDNSGKVSLVIRAPAAYLPELLPALRQRGVHASVALAEGSPPALRAAVLHEGDEPLFELGGGSVTRWIHARRLAREVATLGGSGHNYYVTPSRGFTLGDYLLARHEGALPVKGALRIGSSERVPDNRLRAGQVIEVTIDPDAPNPLRPLDELLRALDRRRLTAAPLGGLPGKRGRFQEL